MLALLGLVASIGLADSINPSTIAPALYYASSPRPRTTLVAFAAGALAMYFAGGVTVLLGGRELVTALLPHPSAQTKHALELAGGLILLGVATGIWLLRERVSQEAAKQRRAGGRSAFVLGMAVMTIELPTAFPYFAALAAIGASGRNAVVQLALVALYDALFVLPVLAILAVRTLAGPRGERLLEALREWVQRNAAAVLTAVLGTIGLAATALGVSGLV